MNSRREKRAAQALIVNGVTGARDLGSDLNQVDAWRREIASGSRIGPRIFRAGPLVDGPKKMPPDREAITVVVTNPDEARSAVTTLKQRGVDLIKIHIKHQPHAGIAQMDRRQPDGVSPVRFPAAPDFNLDAGSLLLTPCTKSLTLSLSTEHL